MNDFVEIINHVSAGCAFQLRAEPSHDILVFGNISGFLLPICALGEAGFDFYAVFVDCGDEGFDDRDLFLSTLIEAILFSCIQLEELPRMGFESKGTLHNQILGLQNLLLQLFNPFR